MVSRSSILLHAMDEWSDIRQPREWPTKLRAQLQESRYGLRAAHMPQAEAAIKCGFPKSWGYANSWLVYKGKSHLEMDDHWGYPYVH